MARIDGTSGNNILNGTDANDSIYGYAGHDKLFGGKGSDKLFGGDGDDYLNGGGSTRGELDELTGGAGKDTFSLVTNLQTIGGKPVADPGYLNDDVLNTKDSSGFAVITDFKLGEDKIELDGYAAHYQIVPVSWGQTFGSADKTDYAIIWQGPEQDKSDVVAVLQDVSEPLNDAYLRTSSFKYTN
jgi:hypothetical protein